MSVALGVDYGTRRLGLAVSDDLGMLATGRAVVQVRSVAQALDAVVQAVNDYHAEQVVVGLPLNMDGSAGPMAQAVEAFVTTLRERLDMPVATWDERLTSEEAERILIEADVSRAKRKKVLDKMAAQAILQGWLDAQAE